MESTQAHRSGTPAEWTPGSLNRGFVSLDPERQREDTGEPAADPCAFGVRPPARRRRAPSGARDEAAPQAPRKTPRPR